MIIVFAGSSDECPGTKSVERIKRLPKDFVKVVQLINIVCSKISPFFLLDNFIHRLRAVSNKIPKEDNKITNADNFLHKLTFTDLRKLKNSDLESIDDLCVCKGQQRLEQKHALWNMNIDAFHIVPHIRKPWNQLAAPDENKQVMTVASPSNDLEDNRQIFFADKPLIEYGTIVLLLEE